jgi:serine/threonine-protein kinase
MATVYQGQQLSLQRPVAIKVLNSQMQDHTEVRQSFEREAVIIAGLSHPNIIPVIDRGLSEQGTPFFIMEYVDGVDLARVMRDGQLGLTRKLEIVLQIARALACAHRNGVVHRDIKPANVIVDRDWHVRVVDFGIALLYADDPTQTKSIMGTEAYMAPETKHSVTSATASSDIYSLGVILFQLLTGRLPSEGVCAPSSINPEVTPSLDKLTLSCLAPRPQQRPQRAEEVCDSLLELLHGAHLDSHQAARAQAALGKKHFELLDIWRETAHEAIYLFSEQKSRRRYVVKKATREHGGYTMGRRLAGLQHPNLIKLHGVSKSENAFITVMDHAAGGNLQERLSRVYTLDEMLPLARQIGLGLAFAHRNNVVHGNLRPCNVLFDQSDIIKLSDFGWPSHRAQSAQVQALNERSGWYPLPQEPPSVRSDIYACGVIFYRLLVGGLPRYHEGKLAVGRAFKRLPVGMRRLLQAMLSQNPQSRPGSMEEVLQSLEGFNDAMPTQVWQPQATEATEQPAGQDEPNKRKKQLLLLLLLVILLLVLMNAGVVALFEGGRGALSFLLAGPIKYPPDTGRKRAKPVPQWFDAWKT